MSRSNLVRRLLSVALLAVSSVVFLPEQGRANAPAGKKYALVIGIRDYDHTSPRKLRYTDKVEELAKLLNKKEAGFASVRVLTSTRGKDKAADRPTRANI